MHQICSKEGIAHVIFFQALITDIAANKHVLDEINNMADDMIKSNHSKSRQIRKQQKEINDQ